MRSKGFTLVEAMIALLVLSIGLLGVAAMQLKALQSAHIGYQRSIASMAAQDVVELMWSRLPESKSSCPSASKNEWDRDDKWRSRWEVVLPGLSSKNPVDSVENSSSECGYKVTISWSESRLVEGANISSMSYMFKLPKL